MSDTKNFIAASATETAAEESTEAANFGAAGFADAETREILNLLGTDVESAGSCCGGSCCS
ncbi:hypothetical protein ICM05_00680 [Leucobacter sp. cx-42]|uniref:hypothetical protein n=1 Tax=unclassified Leucobacter TaxID=2621730 RepID=UPI00165E891F|nr:MULTISPECIES: hypothetical protein [unclassified Leucobacter]MBC9953163.1 hypothetical protein [Leucobacter sp. cx-42]